MGGMEALRGFLYQGFASVLEALADGGNWDKIYVEYPTPGDKVDIALEERGQIIRCIQVKSTKNFFSKKKIQDWINELIGDKESPEYKLYLIGQCGRAAGKFINSVEKYYTNTLDGEAEASLKGFDRCLLENKRIWITVLPFEVVILKKILRDSLLKYISHSNRKMLFNQIDFIASVMVEKQMISSMNGNGMDKNEFDERLKDCISLTEDEHYRQRTLIEIISFDCKEDGEKALRLSFLDKFDGRELKEEYSWDKDIYTGLEEFLHDSTGIKGVYHLFLKAHISIAFAAGRILNSKSGINVLPIQKTANKGVMLWDVGDGNKADYCDWEIVDEKLQEGRLDSALILNVCHNIKDEVIQFIENRKLPIGRLISCIPQGGATNISIKDGTHAYLLAYDVHRAISGRSIEERRAVMHIFAAVPAVFMFFLGQNSLGFGKCILYEYDFEQRNSCTYSQSMSFLN